MSGIVGESLTLPSITTKMTPSRERGAERESGEAASASLAVRVEARRRRPAAGATAVAHVGLSGRADNTRTLRKGRSLLAYQDGKLRALVVTSCHRLARDVLSGEDAAVVTATHACHDSPEVARKAWLSLAFTVTHFAPASR